VLIYTRIPNETSPEAHVLAPDAATVGHLLDQVRSARSTKGRNVNLMIEGAVETAGLADLGVMDGDLLEVAVMGEARPLPAPRPADDSIDFTTLAVAPVSKKKKTEYEAVTELLQWQAPFHIDGHRPSQTVWTDESTVLQCVDWEAYRSPDKLYYRTYVARQARNDRSVSTAFRYAEESGQLATVDTEHVQLMRRVVGALQYPDWGLCMLHQHITRFAMSSWIAGATSFIMFDELRHAQLYGRLAISYGEVFEGFDDPRAGWLEDPILQPMRRVIEELLAVLDWGKALVIGGLLLEPVFTPTFHALIAGSRGRDGDSLSPFVCQSIEEDKVRHRASVMSFVDMVARDAQNGDVNRGLIATWAEDWLPRVIEAALTLADGDAGIVGVIESARTRVQASLASISAVVDQ
jgi:hypothetical protein